MKSTSIKENKLLSIVSVILYAVFVIYIFLLGLYNVAPGFVEKLKLLEDNHAFFGGITYNWFEITMAMTFRYAFVFSLGLAGCIILAVKCQIGKKENCFSYNACFLFRAVMSYSRVEVQRARLVQISKYIDVLRVNSRIAFIYILSCDGN